MRRWRCISYAAALVFTFVLAASADIPEPLTQDLGAIPDVGSHTVVFHLPPAPEGGLQILDIRTPCGCTVPSYEAARTPSGESAEITVNLDAAKIGRYGPVVRELTVLTSVEAWGAIPLRILATVYPAERELFAVPELVRLGDVIPGQSFRTDFDLFVVGPREELPTVEPKSVDIRVRRSELPQANGAWRIHMEGTAPVDEGAFQKGMRVTLPGRANASLDLSVQGNVLPLVDARPRKVYFGVLPSNTAARQVVSLATATGAPLVVDRVRADTQYLQAEVDGTNADGSVRVIIQLNEASPAGRFASSVEIETAKPDRRRITVPVYWTRAPSSGSPEEAP